MRFLAFLLRAYLVFMVAFVLSIFSMINLGRVKPSYVVDIQRTAATAEEADRIARAESECPPYEAVANIYYGTPPAESSECLWWYEEAEVRTAYAITGDAITYYAGVVQAWEQEAREVAVHFTYEAHVEQDVPDPELPEVKRDAVRMYLSFGYACGGLCGTGFSKERSVYFGELGEVVAVEGDGETEYWVAK